MKETGSPCNGVCVMDEDTELCVGCLRTSDEIAGWAEYSEEQKETVMKKIALREAENLG